MCRNCDFVLSQAPLSKYKIYGGEQKVVNGGTVKTNLFRQNLIFLHTHNFPISPYAVPKIHHSTYHISFFQNGRYNYNNEKSLKSTPYEHNLMMHQCFFVILKSFIHDTHMRRQTKNNPVLTRSVQPN